MLTYSGNKQVKFLLVNKSLHKHWNGSFQNHRRSIFTKNELQIEIYSLIVFTGEPEGIQEQ